MEKVKTFLFTIVIFCCSFVLMSFSDDLKFKFTSNMDNSNNSIFILNDSDVKERIISEYSQQYYEKLLDVGNIFSSIHYDSIQNYFYVYAWKNHIFELKNKFCLRYYPDNDSIATNLIIDGLEIDKTGFCDYNGWDKYPKQLMPFIIDKALDGHATAQLILAIYHTGGFKDIPENKNEAFKWAHKSAEQGLSSAQCLLGKCYEKGLGTSVDGKKAVYWMSKAAEQDNLTAIGYLADYYAIGELVPKDNLMVVDLYIKACDQDIQAQYILGNIFWDGKFISSDKEMAMECFLTAAEYGNIDAQITLGNLYLESEYIAHDYKKSLYWFTKAAEQGNAGMQYFLAYIYMQENMPMVMIDENGELLKQIKKLTAPDIENGVIWLTRSAEQGDINAQRSLAVFYYEKGNIEEAKKWFRLTAEQGDDIHILYDIY